MFSIRLRPRNRRIKVEHAEFGSEELNKHSMNDKKEVFEIIGHPDHDPPALLEASFGSLSSSISSFSFEEEEDISISTTKERRVSFLLKEHHDDGSNCKRSSFRNRRKMFQETKGKKPSLNLSFLKSQRGISPIQSESIKSAQPLLRGDIPLAKVVIREDLSTGTQVSNPNTRLWMVGTLPDEDEKQPCHNEEEEEEDIPFDERADRNKEQESIGPFDEQGVQCQCCKSSAAVTCVTCTQIKVEDLGDGKWTVGTQAHEMSVTLPPGTDIQADLPRDVVIDSDSVLDDLQFCIPESNVPKWNAESILLVIFQLFVLKVSSSM